jgi:hypothetical protein
MSFLQQRLGEDVCRVVLSSNVLHLQLLGFHKLSDEKIPSFNVLGPG